MKRQRVISEDDRRLGEAVRSARIHGGRTLHELAAEVGVSYQQLAKYERGENRIDAVRLRELALALGIGPATLLDAAWPARARPAGRRAAASGRPTERERLELQRIYEGIQDPARRRQVRDFARTVAELAG